MEIGERIRERRRELGITQEEFAELSGVSQGYVSQVESCFCEPTATKIIAFSEVLHISADELLGLKSEREKIIELIEMYRRNKKKFVSAEKFLFLLEHLLKRRL